MNSRRLAVHFDPNRSTSGQRFFSNLQHLLKASGVETPNSKSEVVLFNISAPLSKMLKARLRCQTIVVRVDGLYFDRLSDAFLESFRPLTRAALKIASRIPVLRDWVEDIANLLNKNWTGFLRVVLADHVVYQSCYSRRVHQRYFPHKPSSIIVNGAHPVFDVKAARTDTAGGAVLRLISIFDDWKPAKRMVELIQFVHWANETERQAVHLTLLGYTGRFPACAPSDIAFLVTSKPYFTLLPRFSSFDGSFRETLLEADMYATFSFRDPCPNVVVEAMAHGLPVLAVASGGLPDIVGDAGTLLSDLDDGRPFSASRYESDFPPIDFEQALQAAQSIKAESVTYRERVRRRFETDLGMEVVAARYLAVLRSIA